MLIPRKQNQFKYETNVPRPETGSHNNARTKLNIKLRHVEKGIYTNKEN